MHGGRQRRIIPAMTYPLTSPKLVLVGQRREAAAPSRGPVVRRYRLARVQTDGRSRDAAARFEHLKRVHD
jgi:hypothetical protein